MNLIKIICALSVALIGCVPGDIRETEDATETDGGTGTTQPDQTCTNPLTVGTTPSGRTWSRCDEWGAWAESTTAEDIAQRVTEGELAPTDSPVGATCYVVDVDVLLCTVEVGPLLLLGMPVDQVTLSEDASPCDGLFGPWDLQAWTGLTCLGLFESSGVAVEIY